MLNIFKRELKANRKSLIIWAVILLFLTVAGFGEYGIVVKPDSGMDIGAIVNVMPKAVRAVFGMGTLPIDTPEGWYACMFIWCAILVFIHAALLGSSIIAKEESDRTSEFLYTKPISRKDIMTGKILAALINVFIMAFITWASTLLIFGQYADKTLIGQINLSMICMFIIQILFLFIGLFLSAVFEKKGKAMRISATAVIVTYLISVIMDIYGNIDLLNFLSFLTPFKYFDVADIVTGKGISPAFVILSAVLIVAAGYLTYFSYKRRDIHT